MSKLSGKSIAISPFRGLVTDLLYFAGGVPAATIDRRMNLAPLVAARQACFPRPTWTSLLVKAYSIVSAAQPALRRSFMKFPWARIYEHPKNIATINVSRRVDGEDVVLQGLIRSPENRTLPDLDAIVRYYKETPVEQLGCYRRARRTSYLPQPVRRALMWATLNVFGRRRCHNFGTFAITSVADHGAGVLNVMLVATTMLHFGLLDDKGCLDMRLGFDHRVIDGAPAADALVGLEAALLGVILDEVKSLARDVPPLTKMAA
jgi:hypothetical protein